MPSYEAQARRVLSAWFPTGAELRLEPLGRAGGFSGAMLWRVSDSFRKYCLRRWPAEHPSPDQLAWIHAVLAHVRQASCPLVAVPLPVKYPQANSSTFVQQADNLWELSPWLPGEPHEVRIPSPVRLHAALSALARFHVAAATYRPALALKEVALQSSQLPFGPSPGLKSRGEKLAALLRPGELESLRERVLRSGHWAAGVSTALELLSLVSLAAPRVQQRLTRALSISTALQPCLRDIWSDHVLFTGDEVTGLIDYGAMRYECVAGDLARLLGSFVGDDGQQWQAGLAAYQEVQPLGPEVRTLIPTFDQTQILLGGMNWLRWIYVDGREFSDLTPILARLKIYIHRLTRLLE